VPFNLPWIPRRQVVKFKFLLHKQQTTYYGSLSNVLSRLAVGVRVDGDDETQRKESSAVRRTSS
jgi:hypothetical protein